MLFVFFNDTSTTEIDTYLHTLSLHDALKNYSVLPGDDVDRGLQASRQQRAAPLFAQRFGATVGSEFIGRKKLGQSMLRLTYIERTQKQPLPWAFYFYLTSNGWVLSEFGWSAQPAALYDAD